VDPELADLPDLKDASMDEPVSDASDWVDVAALDDLWDGAGQPAIVLGREIALFRSGDEVFATEPMCNHGLARLCEGFVEGHEVECPLHQGRFDLRSGAPTCPPVTQPIRVFATRVAAGRVWTKLG
jgi:naphthalene 1,2-dioxygenase ferredoxin component